MFKINNWLQEIQTKLKDTFKEKLLFIGYQGSYRRNEATENSDIDMVVVLEKLGIEELKQYRQIVESMEFSEKACGFISGKEEIKNWSKHELFQLYNDTAPLFGDMKELIPALTKEDAKNAMRIGLQGLYHMACHSFLYSTDKKQSLIELYKGIFFVLQAKYFYENEEYILSKKELVENFSGIESEILKISLNRDSINDYTSEQIDNCYEMLISFCSNNL